VKNWIIVAQKLGAPVIRIFPGKEIPDGYTWDKVAEWMVKDIQECVKFGREHGVIVALQHHNDFLKTADETIDIVNAVDSEWFGVILDVGSLRMHDPYVEIEKLLPYAVSWQLKEHVWINGEQVPVDLDKIKAIIEKGGYRGFLPIETLGEGDPAVKVERFLKRVRKVLV
jgi:sugar phosphate isomerase/epimerase